jgi:hypothetical protein
MRNLLVVFISFLFSCQPRDNFFISGNLPDQTYNGEIIYIVPIDKPIKGYVDSMIVSNGAISFEGMVTKQEICVIRAKPVLRYNLEELLIIREPGSLTLKLGKSSSVHGTALNDSLQYWKERKMRYDFVNAELIKRFHESKDDAEKQILKAKQDSLMSLSNRFHFNFVLRNKDNIVGQFAQKVMAGSFTEEQKQALIKK